MGKIFVTSDTHFGHNKPFLYEPRGFSTIEDHNRQIIENWNEVVEDKDDVYVLGDLTLGPIEDGLSCLAQLRGRLHICRGNHDTDNRWAAYAALSNVVALEYIYVMKYTGYRFYLSHYPTLTSNYDDGRALKKHLINLCGHSHTKDRFADWNKGKIYHCELDAHSNFPILLTDIITDCEEKYVDEI